MRTLLFASLAAGLLLGLADRAFAQDKELKAVIAKAVKAHGGEDKLAKIKAIQSKSKGKIHLQDGIDFTDETSVVLPGKLKSTKQLEVGGHTGTQVLVLNGNKAWVKARGDTQELPEHIVKNLQDALYAERVATLVPLLADKGFELSPLGETKVDGRPAVGVKVATKGHRDLSLYFDKENGLLVKSASRITDQMSQEEVDQERFYHDYKEVGGVQRAMRLVVQRGGQPFMEIQTSELQFVDSIPDNTFAEP